MGINFVLTSHFEVSELDLRFNLGFKVQRSRLRSHFATGIEWLRLALGLAKYSKSPMKHMSDTLLIEIRVFI